MEAVQGPGGTTTATSPAKQPNIHVNLPSAGSPDYLNTDVLRLSNEVGQLRQELQGYTQLMHQTLQAMGTTLASIQQTQATMLEQLQFLQQGAVASQQAKDAISQLGLALGSMHQNRPASVQQPHFGGSSGCGTGLILPNPEERDL